MSNYYPELYCVECGGIIKELVCLSCKKIYKKIDGIPLLISTQDDKSELFGRYMDNYSQIAKDRIKDPILVGNPVYYTEAQTDKLVHYCSKEINGTVLDVGAGEGQLLDRIPHNSKVAVDVAIEFLQILKNRGVCTIIANAENLPFENSFDLVVATDILEHVFHPEKVLDSIFRALKNNGKVVIRVPYKEELSMYKTESGCKYEFSHLRSFDEVSLERLLNDANLRLEKIYYDGFLLMKLRKNSKNPIVKIFARNVYPKLVWSKYDPIVCKLPNWLGSMFFNPIEITVVARKCHG
jgi:SAM-dependent methyltransferase